MFFLSFLLLSSLISFVQSDPFVFGSGCFWGRQHAFVQLEQHKWNRTASTQITTTGGYFGGNPTSTEACYYNQHSISVYSQEGHAEVVTLDVPSIHHLKEAFHVYFQSFVRIAPTSNIWVREDNFDAGPGYRAMIGFVGGIHNVTVMNLLRNMNTHNVTYKEAQGSDSDTLGLNLIWIYDTGAAYEEAGNWQMVFPVHQSELCLQFHNNQTGTYSKKYHALKETLIQSGRLKETKCPMPEIDSCL